MTNSTEPTGIIGTICRLLPGSKYRVESTISAADVSTRSVFKGLVSRFSASRTSFAENILSIQHLERSLDLGFKQKIIPPQIVDRWLWKADARIAVSKQGGSVTITADITQSWTPLAALLLLGILLLVGWLILAGTFLKVTMFTNAEVQSAMQRALDGVANDLQRTSAIESLV